MLIPTGSTVETSTASSAAVFMGGVDSARLVPDSGMTVTQGMEGTVRHTLIDLKKGAVFSRVGKRPGETQKYEVQTPEGVAAARGTEFADEVYEDLHLVFVNKGTVDLFIDGKLVGTVIGGQGVIGQDAMGHHHPSKHELQRILNQLLTTIQPYNVTTIQALFDYESGKATPEEVALIQQELYGSLNNPDGSPGLTSYPPLGVLGNPAPSQDVLPPTPQTPPPDEPVGGTVPGPTGGT